MPQWQRTTVYVLQRSRLWKRQHQRCFASTIDEVCVTDTASYSKQHQVRLATAIRPYFEKQTPLVLRGAVSHVPATSKWTSWEYLEETISNETTAVTGAVEIGGSYGSSEERAEIPVLDYIQYLKFFEEKHGRNGPETESEDENPLSLPTIPQEELVYMAQNDLFSCLYSGVQVPSFCEAEEWKVGLGRLYSVMFWLGPRGCTSPLHYDPLDNVLMQIVGRKLVLLHNPKSTGSGHFYSGHEGQQSNTSPVNPELHVMDPAQYPDFVKESPLQCILHPGDLLYIPSKWWHFVRSLDTSASVNVWWR